MSYLWFVLFTGIQLNCHYILPFFTQLCKYLYGSFIRENMTNFYISKILCNASCAVEGLHQTKVNVFIDGIMLGGDIKTQELVTIMY